MNLINGNFEENFIHTKYGYCYYFIEDLKAIIFNLYIYPEYRQQEKAKKLLNLIINEIREIGYKDQILIEAIPQENSINSEKLILFYQNMGLKILEKENFKNVKNIT